MPRETVVAPEEAVNLQGMILAESAEIECRRKQVFTEAAVSKKHLTALSLSGGGIRSACFNLGLLEGLDRIPYQPASKDDTAPLLAREGNGNHLELFDYLSSVSGGSYAAGHLATAMLPPNPRPDPDEPPHPNGPEHAEPPDNGEVHAARSAEVGEWLGKVPLTSKTIPGWLWGVGVWFLGVAFQLMKTVSLLLFSLALIAFAMRTLDAPDAGQFCDVLGLESDVERGFVPFWLMLGVFLVGYGLYVSKWNKLVPLAWFLYTAIVIHAYAIVVWIYDYDYPDNLATVPFWLHYGFLMALAAPVMVVCIVVGMTRILHRIVPALSAKTRREFPDDSEIDHTNTRFNLRFLVSLRKVLLIPMLTLLFCLAALVTTGDIGLAPPRDGSAHLLVDQQQKSRDMAEAGNWIYRLAMSMLATTSLAFLFPKSLFRSIRRVEDNPSAQSKSSGFWFRGKGWEPIFRVVIFLCSYGFVLLVIFVLYGLVAGENVSGYYDWRENQPSAAFHPQDFRDPEQAWERIAQDADASHNPVNVPSPVWGKLASRLMDARSDPNLSLDAEYALDSKKRALESNPWMTCLAPSWGDSILPNLWAHGSPKPNHLGKALYDVKVRITEIQNRVARRIADQVLSNKNLYQDLPRFEQAFPSKTLDANQRRATEFAWNRYMEKARVLASLDSPDADYQAAIRNNNRQTLQFYLGDLMRNRHDHVVFASIVWPQDQWTRLRILMMSGLVWLLCCSVDVNTFSLQRFYRGHVIDSWVRVPPGKTHKRWLHETDPTYRGIAFQGFDPSAGGPSAPRPGRAPLLLINATLEGNRSLGDEPDLTGHIFTFSPIGSGSGVTGYWLNGEDGRRSLARRSDLDLGNIVATSGAFLSPGTVANPALSAILHLFNIQTGYWAHDPKRFEKRDLVESLLFHIYQSLGIDCEHDSRFMLTDGAHSDCLGLFVLLQRRCSLIVASDCSQEDRVEKPVRRFDALIQVLQQARVEGIEVGPFLSSRAYRHWLQTGCFPPDGGDRNPCLRSRTTGLDLVRPCEASKSAPPNQSAPTGTTENPPCSSARDASGDDGKPRKTEEAEVFSQEHYVFAQIVYPDKTRGLLVYLRPTLTGDEGDSMLHGVADSGFPDDDPLDQFYTPMKMTTYRILGRHIAEELMNDPVMKDALARIFAGNPATSEPPEFETSTTSASCDSYCGPKSPNGPNRPCLWNHQRAFRPPIPPR